MRVFILCIPHNIHHVVALEMSQKSSRITSKTVQKAQSRRRRKRRIILKKKSDVIQYSPSSKKKATIETRRSSHSLSTKHRDEVPSGSGNISQNNPAKDEFELKDKFDASGKF